MATAIMSLNCMRNVHANKTQFEYMCVCVLKQRRYVRRMTARNTTTYILTHSSRRALDHSIEYDAN